MLWNNPIFQIPDGQAKRKGFTARDADKRELARGTEHELEHTTSRRIARQIALDHLAEDEDYYRKLEKMEKGLCRNPLSELWASSKDRYRASAAEKRMYGGSTVTEFYVGRKGDENDASKWVVQVGYGKTPGERKTDAMRRAAPRLGVVP